MPSNAGLALQNYLLRSMVEHCVSECKSWHKTKRFDKTHINGLCEGPCAWYERRQAVAVEFGHLIKSLVIFMFIRYHNKSLTYGGNFSFSNSPRPSLALRNKIWTHSHLRLVRFSSISTTCYPCLYHEHCYLALWQQQPFSPYRKLILLPSTIIGKLLKLFYVWSHFN